MNKILKNALIGLVLILAVLQFFQISKVNPPVVAEKDFINIHQPDEKIRTLLKDACYDCHSHETKYPWYTNIVPLSYWIKNHIVKGREELNFSNWADYSDKKADHKLEESSEKVSEKKMPLKSYTFTHSNAKLNQEQIKLLSEYFNGLRKNNTSDQEESEDDHE
jgi:hypothetical protein